MDEDGVLAEMEDPSKEEVWQYYGEIKVLCERTLDSVMPGRALCIRAGLIAGPRDTMDRFTYWPTRVARGGQVFAPGHPNDPIQIIDVRDLAEWTIRMVEAKQTEAYNVGHSDI